MLATSRCILVIKIREGESEVHMNMHLLTQPDYQYDGEPQCPCLINQFRVCKCDGKWLYCIAGEHSGLYAL